MNVVFHWRSSSLEGCLPLKVVFHCVSLAYTIPIQPGFDRNNFFDTQKHRNTFWLFNSDLSHPDPAIDQICTTQQIFVDIISLPLVHLVSSLEDPAHHHPSSPPMLGAWLQHCLVLLFIPVLALQGLQDLHILHSLPACWLPGLNENKARTIYQLKLGRA